MNFFTSEKIKIISIKKTIQEEINQIKKMNN